MKWFIRKCFIFWQELAANVKCWYSRWAPHKAIIRHTPSLELQNGHPPLGFFRGVLQLDPLTFWFSSQIFFCASRKFIYYFITHQAFNIPVYKIEFWTCKTEFQRKAEKKSWTPQLFFSQYKAIHPPLKPWFLAWPPPRKFFWELV